MGLLENVVECIQRNSMVYTVNELEKMEIKINRVVTTRNNGNRMFSEVMKRKNCQNSDGTRIRPTGKLVEDWRSY